MFLSCSQGRISQLEEDLTEERCSADRLMERLDKTKAQAGLLPCRFTLCVGQHVEIFPSVTRQICEHPALHLF